jgi:hypothetical protein
VWWVLTAFDLLDEGVLPTSPSAGRAGIPDERCTKYMAVISVA